MTLLFERACDAFSISVPSLDRGGEMTRVAGNQPPDLPYVSDRADYVVYRISPDHSQGGGE